MVHPKQHITKYNYVLDLSSNRKKEMRWLGSNEIDKALLMECAYYPLPPCFGHLNSGCIECSISEPRKSCQHSHILTGNSPKASTRRSNKIKRILELLSEEDREALEEFIRIRKEVR